MSISVHSCVSFCTTVIFGRLGFRLLFVKIVISQVILPSPFSATGKSWWSCHLSVYSNPYFLQSSQCTLRASMWWRILYSLWANLLHPLTLCHTVSFYFFTVTVFVLFLAKRRAKWVNRAWVLASCKVAALIFICIYPMVAAMTSYSSWRHGAFLNLKPFLMQTEQQTQERRIVNPRRGRFDTEKSSGAKNADLKFNGVSNKGGWRW